MIETGDIVNGYRIMACVGQGGIGTVYQGEHTETGLIVGLKRINPAMLDRHQVKQRLEREITITQMLQHPHIVKLLEHWHDDETLWMALEWVEGGSLRDQLAAGPWSLQKTAHMLHQICDALAAAHAAQVIHRDIKPDNILINAAGDAYLADFGAAKPLNKAGITGVGTLVGSPAYLSPEQIMTNKVAPQTDVYQMGMTLYETLTGIRPFSEIKHSTMLLLALTQQPLPNCCEVNTDLPPAVNEVIQTATAKAMADRYSDIMQLAHAFDAAIS